MKTKHILIRHDWRRNSPFSYANLYECGGDICWQSYSFNSEKEIEKEVKEKFPECEIIKHYL